MEQVFSNKNDLQYSVYASEIIGKFSNYSKRVEITFLFDCRCVKPRQDSNSMLSLN
jgi:hypothetical protein